MHRFKLALSAILVSSSLGIVTAEENEAPRKDGSVFKVIEVEQTGGFAGVKTTYRITPDGKFTRKSRQGIAKGQLTAKETKDLAKAVSNIDWKKIPAKLRDPNVADDFLYDMHIVIGKKTHRVTADGISAGKHAKLKPILQTLNKIQRVPVTKPES